MLDRIIKNDQIASFPKSFRGRTAAKEVLVFFWFSFGGQRKENVTYLGKTNSQKFFNDEKQGAFCLTVQSHPGFTTPAVPKFFFDISKHYDDSSFLFLDRSFRPIMPCDCVEVGYEKCDRHHMRYVCEQQMYVVYDESGKVRVEEWFMSNDPRYVGAGMLQIKMLNRGPKYLTLRNKFLRQRKARGEK